MKMMAETDYETMVMEKGAYLLEGLQELQAPPQDRRRRRRPGPGAAHGDLRAARQLHAVEGDRRPHGGRGARRAISRSTASKYGLVLDIGGYYKNVITLAPSLHITKHEMDLALKLLDRVMQRVSDET